MVEKLKVVDSDFSSLLYCKELNTLSNSKSGVFQTDTFCGRRINRQPAAVGDRQSNLRIVSQLSIIQ